MPPPSLDNFPDLRLCRNFALVAFTMDRNSKPYHPVAMASPWEAGFDCQRTSSPRIIPRSTATRDDRYPFSHHVHPQPEQTSTYSPVPRRPSTDVPPEDGHSPTRQGTSYSSAEYKLAAISITSRRSSKAAPDDSPNFVFDRKPLWKQWFVELIFCVTSLFSFASQSEPEESPEQLLTCRK